MFSSRIEAGKLLGEKLQEFCLEKPVVLGITRGGVVVAAEVAKILRAPLYPLVVKKIGSPFNPEFAVGAVGPDSKDAAEQVKKFGAENLAQKIKNKTIIIVDDGMATGWTIRAAIQYVAGLHPARVTVAVPVADESVVKSLKSEFKETELVVLEQVDGLGAVGNFYEDFSQVTDEEVKVLIGVDRDGKRWKTEK